MSLLAAFSNTAPSRMSLAAADNAHRAMQKKPELGGCGRWRLALHRARGKSQNETVVSLCLPCAHPVPLSPPPFAAAMPRMHTTYGILVARMAGRQSAIGKRETNQGKQRRSQPACGENSPFLFRFPPGSAVFASIQQSFLRLREKTKGKRKGPRVAQNNRHYRMGNIVRMESLCLVHAEYTIEKAGPGV